MARLIFIRPALFGIALGLGACAPSPLYVGHEYVGTFGEIPRDGRGEPIWSAIRQAQVVPPAPAMPIKAGIPIIPPPGY
jgi:hypothetical protein